MKLINNKTFLFVYVLIILSSTNCSNIKEIKIGDAQKVDIVSMNNNIVTLDLTLPIENPNSFRLKVKDGDLRVMLGTKELGKVKQMNDLIITKKSTQAYTIRAKIEITDLKSSLMSAFSLFSGKTLDLTLSGTIQARSFFYGRTFKVENYHISR